MDELYDDILNDNTNNELNGFIFKYISNFRLLDTDKGFSVDFHKLFKRSYKDYKSEMDNILKFNPIDIKCISSIELSEFKINKLYKGFFTVNYYDNDTFDIFLTDYKNI